MISSFKYILRENTKKMPGDKLTAEERKKLLGNFKGYDISPDMVRLSLVNLYLHGFVQPQILEYDTLTSEDRWNEYADVIMANPPFMSPKGGIKPHKKFSVPSNRSEVLFVDYIAEHLRPTGRAAVIVPEGIIFQSAGAYKQLRKMLVEKYLYAVVSLPAGVFNPYSGVKTSILFLDAQLNKKADAILFVKIENDGFGLGAQRREQVGSDLPDAANVLAEYIKAVCSGSLDAFQKEAKPCCALLVKKEKLAENGDYNLTGERYRVIKSRAHQKWPMVCIDDLFIEIKNGKNVEQFDDIGKYRVSRIQTISDGTIDLNKNKWTNDDVDESYFLQEGDILLSHINSIDHLAKSAIFTNFNDKVVHGINLIRFKPDVSRINPHFVARIFKATQFIEKARSFAQKAVNQASIKTSDLKSIIIPLPPLEVQREIVAVIEGYQKLIDGARQVIENWKPQIDIDPAWPIVTLGDVCVVDGELSREIRPKLIYIGADSIESNTGKLIQQKTAGEQGTNGPVYYINGLRLLYSKIRPYLNKLCIIDFEGYCSSDMYPLKFNDVDYLFAFYYMLSGNFNNSIRGFYERSSIPKINRSQLFSVNIPKPSLDKQLEIVAKIEVESKAVDGCRELIDIYESKIKRFIDKVWEE